MRRSRTRSEAKPSGVTSWAALAAAGFALACTFRAARPEPPPPAAEQVEREIERSLGTLDDPALSPLVAELGRRVTAAAGVPVRSLRFSIANVPEVNAFSFPSGNVYVSRGLVGFVRSETELVNVLAHEVAHVIGRHALKLESAEHEARAAASLQVLVATLGGARSDAAMRALALEGAGRVARYSRELEHDADREGQVLAARAGYDPAGMATFLAALDRETTFRLGRPRRPAFLDTHPAAPERAERAATTARRIGAPPPRPEAESAFLDRLEGLLVGEDPSEGRVEHGVFTHPDLALRVAFPPDWRTVNTPAAVLAAPPEGPLVAQLEWQEAYPDPAAASVRFLRAHKRDMVLLESGPLTGASVPAQQAALRIPRPGEPLYARVFWLALGGQIYRLSFLGNAPSFERLARPIEAAAKSFRALTPEERDAFRVRRLHVLPALAGERFEDALARGGNVERLDQIALMNALDVGDRLPAGRRVKVVVEAPYAGPW